LIIRTFVLNDLGDIFISFILVFWQVKLHNDLLGYLKSETFKPSSLNDEKCTVAQGMIGILHNVVQRATGTVLKITPIVSEY